MWHAVSLARRDDPPHDPDEDSIPDADDRVESDILAAPPRIAEREDSLIINPIRHYRHSPNSNLNTVLTVAALAALGFAVGIASGHYIGMV